MWRILQQDKPDDFVLATGETHTVREFVETAFRHIGRTIEWDGHGVHEKGYDGSTGDPLVEVDPTYFRPTEVDLLLGDPTKARTRLNWRHTVDFKDLVAEMVDSDLQVVLKEATRNDRRG